jgi:hypothetical protein
MTSAEKAEVAKQAFEDGDYLKAAMLYQELFAATNLTDMLWNAGRSWEEAAALFYNSGNASDAEGYANKAIIAFTKCSVLTTGDLQEDCLSQVNAMQFLISQHKGKAAVDTIVKETKEVAGNISPLLILGGLFLAWRLLK